MQDLIITVIFNTVKIYESLGEIQVFTTCHIELYYFYG